MVLYTCIDQIHFIGIVADREPGMIMHLVLQVSRHPVVGRLDGGAASVFLMTGLAVFVVLMSGYD